ncbi:MAG: hypothetical protein ACT4OS_10790 [Acidimicrobiales bacterium]
MSPLLAFLAAASRSVRRDRAREWAVRGLAVAAAGSALVQVVSRRWPADPPWAPLVAMLAGGLGVALVGFWRSRPSLVEVAMLADVGLGGRERLFTALELAGGGGELVQRQRADTEGWLASVDPRRLGRRRLPRRAVVVALVGAVVAGGLALAPNGAVDRLRAGRAREATREAGADALAALAAEVAKGVVGPDAARRRALVTELRRAEGAVRQAPTHAAAVAALSRTQATLRGSADPTRAGGRDAAAGAGAELARAGASAEAGTALIAAGTSAGEGLAEMTAGSSGASPEASAELAAALAQAAAEASGGPEPALADQLGRAADEAAAGRPEAARAEMSDAFRRADEARGERAAASLSALAASLAGLAPPAQAELAQALDQAAAAAAGDPALAAALAQAAEQLGQGRIADAQAALGAAATAARNLGADDDLAAQMAAAGAGIQAVKDALLADASMAGSGGDPCATPPPASDDPSLDHTGRGGIDHRRMHEMFSGDAKVQTTPRPAAGARQACPQLKSPAAAGTAGLPGEQGRGGSGGQGSGTSGGSGQARGRGSGQGGGQGHRGGGAAGGGAEGALGDRRPGAPTEQVYVPGRTGPGRAQGLPSGATGEGAGAPLVAYEQVYAEYRAQALTQADRQLVPERLQGLLRDYFGEDE